MGTFETRTSITYLTVPPKREVKRWVRKRQAPQDGALVERYWFPLGTTESDVRIESEATPDLALSEPTAGLPHSHLMTVLESLHRNVLQVLAGFGNLTGYSP